MSVKNKVVLITGGGTGLGEATASLLAEEGAHVILMGRRAVEIERVAESVGAMAIAADAADAASVQKVIAKIIEKFSHLDAVVHCAGVFIEGNAQNTSDEQWGQLLRANLTSVFVTSREALPALVKRRGSIVIISSIAGLEAMPQGVGYVAAKHGVIGLARSMALDFGPQGVRVNTICPGWFRTPMADSEMEPVMAANNFSLDDAYRLVTSDVPLRRAGVPKEVATLCRFLIDDEESSILTGTVIPADGGSTIVNVPTIRI